MVRSHTVTVWRHLLPKKSLVGGGGGEWQTKFNVSPGPGLWPLVLGSFGPDLGPGPGPELDNMIHFIVLLLLADSFPVLAHHLVKTYSSFTCPMIGNICTKPFLTTSRTCPALSQTPSDTPCFKAKIGSDFIVCGTSLKL